MSWLNDTGFTPKFVSDPDNDLCPYGKPGDILWVRERFLNHPIPDEGLKYYADYTDDQHKRMKENRVPLKWKPSIHMPRTAARIFLEITEIKIERLQDISRGDCMAEGCPFTNMADGANPKDWFAELWQSINGSWQENQWVWVLSLKRVEL